MQLDGFDLLDPAKLYEQVEKAGGDTSKFWGKANSYRVQQGRSPGIGWVLVTKGVFESLGDPLSSTHTLLIKDGVRQFEVDKLFILKAESIHGNYPTDGNTAFLLTLTDARHFAQDTSATLDHGLIKYDGSVDAATPKGALPSAFDGLAGLMGSLSVDAGLNASDYDFEELTPLGGSAWDGWLAVIDTFGLQFTLKKDGTPYVYREIPAFQNDPPEDNLAGDTNPQVFVDAEQCLIDWTDNTVKPPLPEKVVVNIRYRDYQWWKEEGRHTPQDHHRAFKLYSKEFRTVDYLAGQAGNEQDAQDARQQVSRIVFNTERSIWAPYSLKTNDQGIDVDSSVMDAKLTGFHRRYINSMIAGENWMEKEFAGAWPFEPTTISAIRWADFGDNRGLTTKIWDVPGEISPEFSDKVRSWEQPLLTPGPPSFARDTMPHSRTAYGICLGTNASAGTGFAEMILPNKKGDVKIQSGHLPVGAADEIDWTDRETVEAWNVTEKPIPVGSRIFLRWNYQIGEHGAWVIVLSQTSEHFIGIATKKIGITSLNVDVNAGPIGNISGSPGGYNGGPNVQLITLDENGFYIWLLDSSGAPIRINALNTCFVEIEANDIVQGKEYEGHWWIDVVCCPSGA
jgi:hypothetical protein